METKFKAYDTIKKKVICEGFHVVGETTMFNLIEQYCNANMEGESGLLKLRGFVIVQFVNLKYRSGRDAYVGDILNDGKGVKYRIREVKGGFAINIPVSKWENDTWPIQSLADEQTASWFESNCEYVGNIFENPELLCV